MAITVKFDVRKYSNTHLDYDSKQNIFLVSESIEEWFQKLSIPFMPWFEVTYWQETFCIKNICFNFETKSQAALFKLRWL